MGWSTPSSNDYALARMGLKKLDAPDDSAAVGSFWQGAKPRDDSGVWEPFNSLPSGRDSGGGQTRTTQWKKVDEPAWKKSAPAPASAPAGGSMAAPAPVSTNSASPELEQSATEARERATIATQTMRATTPQVTYDAPKPSADMGYGASNPNAGTDSALRYGDDVRKWMGSFVDSLNANAGQEAAENKRTMLGAIRALPTNLRLPKPTDVAALYDKYSKDLG